MRPVALGRKNWIHIGSPQAGPKVAAILSVGKLPTVEDYGARLLGLGSSRTHRSANPSRPRPYSHSVGRSAIIGSGERVVSMKVILRTQPHSFLADQDDPSAKAQNGENPVYCC